MPSFNSGPHCGAGPESHSSRRAYDSVTEGFGEGFNGPLAVVAGPQPVHDRVVQVRLPEHRQPGQEVERRHLDQRIASARVWVEQYASEEEKMKAIADYWNSNGYPEISWED